MSTSDPESSTRRGDLTNARQQEQEQEQDPLVNNNKQILVGRSIEKEVPQAKAKRERDERREASGEAESAYSEPEASTICGAAAWDGMQ